MNREEFEDLKKRYFTPEEQVQNLTHILHYRKIKCVDIEDSRLKDSFVVDIRECSPVSLDLEDEEEK